MNDNFDINYAVVSAFERSKRVDKSNGLRHVFPIILMAVFFIALMIGLSTGVAMYHKVSDSQARTSDLHMQTGLLANTIRVNDTARTIEMGDGPEGDALVLVERLDSGTYETRIYRYQGAIVQEYAIAGRNYNPDNATTIVNSDVFEFVYSDGMLTLVTDDGLFPVALRSAQNSNAHVESDGGARMVKAYETSGTLLARGGV